MNQTLHNVNTFKRFSNECQLPSRHLTECSKWPPDTATHDRSLFRNDRIALSVNSWGKSFHIDIKGVFSSVNLVSFGVGLYCPIHTADTTQLDPTRQDKFSTCSVSKFQIFVGSRRELVANSIHTADADATPTRASASAVCIWHIASQYRNAHDNPMDWGLVT